MRVTMFVVALAIAGSAAVASAGEADPFKPFAPLVGKTFKGEFADSTPEKPKHDVMRWERALNGKAIRVLHSVNDGIYGGETIILWDAKKKALVYWYFTTAGFRTEGTMTPEAGQWTSHETVAGASAGITEVKATGKILPDGRVHVKSEYLKDGKWGPGRDMHYQEAPEAKVNFK